MCKSNRSCKEQIAKEHVLKKAHESFCKTAAPCKEQILKKAHESLCKIVAPYREQILIILWLCIEQIILL